MNFVKGLLKGPWKLIVGWFLKDQIKNLPKALEGYKTGVGILLTLVTTAILAAGSSLPVPDAVMLALETFARSFSEPLTPEEKQTAALALQFIFAQAVTLWGLVKKVWKWAKGQPQKPSVPEPIV